LANEFPYCRVRVQGIGSEAHSARFTCRFPTAADSLEGNVARTLPRHSLGYKLAKYYM
jgi:hypothetical protein